MKKFFIISVVAMVLTACSQDTTNDYSTPEMRVGFDDETRVQLNEECKTVWNRGDMVSVFNKTDANSCWRYRGADLARSGAIALVSSPSTYTVTFADVYGVYPYNANYSINMLGEISLSIPAEQNWKDGSYGVGDNIMVAIGEDENLSFKNIFGWLKLQFTGSDAISKITFRGNNNEPLTGAITYDPYYMEVVFSEGAGKEITLICPEVALEADKVQTFYIAIAPQTFEKGLTVEVVCSDGSTMAKSTEKEVVIARNTIQPMAAIEYIETQRNNEIWYTSSDGNVVTPNRSDVFGANIVSNTYKNGKGVIKFDDNITSIGSFAFYDCDSLTSVTIPDSVTSIGSCAFNDCTSLTSVTIPDSVTSIGEEAFSYCSSLTSVTIGDSVTSIGLGAFSYCTSLTSITIPDSVTEIGGHAFSYCTSLTSVTIPNSVTEIGWSAFYGCSSLTSVTIPDSVISIGSNAFRNCDSLTAFYGKFASADNRCLIIDGVLRFFARKGLTEYTIPNSVTSIGSSAFYDCDSLTSVTIGDSVTTIRDYAFYKCTSLTSVTIGDSVTSIGESVFHGCTSLTSVTIPDSVTEIGVQAFFNCTSLKEVYCYTTIPPSLGSYAFDSNASGRRIYVYEECVELYKSAWSSYKDSIYNNGKNCPDTTTIEYTTNDGNIITSSKLPIISNSYENGVGTLVVVGKIAQIPSSAFYKCTSLTSITIPDSVTEIGGHAFSYCTSLTSVTIGDSVTEIEFGAFSNCTSLKEVYCKPTTPPSGYYNMFDDNDSDRKIYVPRASVDAYKAASYWSKYKSYIEPYDFE